MKKIEIPDEYFINNGFRFDLLDDGEFEIDCKFADVERNVVSFEGIYYPVDGEPVQTTLDMILEDIDEDDIETFDDLDKSSWCEFYVW